MNIIKNKIINKQYYITDKYLAGLVLKGWEVKNLKIYNSIEIKNSYIINIKNEIFLKNSIIYENKKSNNKEIKRNRKLLLKRKEIKIILNKIKNFKIIPFNIFLKKNIIKINIVVVIKKLIF
ncbi:SsrA-binding protein [Candidatus Nasuia deltocephalinicola]|uniref:SsrA-binding protein n=1 Tax=Candidatus Nasuia deltocephalincola TaxID=1160784 RepID=UPI00216B156A|nr:SsrA-binding protein [Candidatus Nasuia deltocephalinicola]